MNKLLTLTVLGCLLSAAPAAIAAEWREITRNDVGDRFMIDTSSLDRRGNSVWFWEYRDFPQPNNAFLEETVDQPVHGAVIYRSVDCTSGIQRLRRIIAYNKDKKVIQRFNYDDKGALSKPNAGSSAATLTQFACTNAPATPPASPTSSR